MNTILYALFALFALFALCKSSINTPDRMGISPIFNFIFSYIQIILFSPLGIKGFILFIQVA